MELPRNGRTIIIDDKVEEALPLINALQNNGIPYLYFDGAISRFPAQQLTGIRLIFLDIVLKGMSGQDDKTKASALANRLKKLLSIKNGPYAIIFWTKHEEVVDYVVENCKKAKIPPVLTIDMEKSDCLDRKTNEFEMDKIYTKLEEKLKKLGAFNLYIEWENNLHRSSTNFVHDFSSLIETGNNWSNDTANLFYVLYKSYVEKKDVRDPNERFKCACTLMNRSFSDSLHRHTSQHLKLPDDFKLNQGTVSSETKAKLNTKLFFTNQILSRPSPGDIYLEQNKKLLSCMVDAIFKAGKDPGARLCKIIVTPECDIAHNKILKVKEGENENDTHRIIHGVVFPYDKTIDRNIKDGEALFKIGPYWNNGKSNTILFHFGTISYEYKKSKFKNPLFSLKRDLLFDLQSKAANHVNRLGNFQIK